MATAAPGDAIKPAEPPVTPRRAAPSASESPSADDPGNDDGAAVEANEAEEVEEEGYQDEDEDEPKLKYHRLTGSLSSPCTGTEMRRAASWSPRGTRWYCAAVGLHSTANQVQILGTHNGNAVVSGLQEDPDRLTVSERLVDSVLPTFTNISRPFGHDYYAISVSPYPDSLRPVTDQSPFPQRQTAQLPPRLEVLQTQAWHLHGRLDSRFSPAPHPTTSLSRHRQ